jgi:acyl transferase domain-containing protein/acyl carrier protein
MKNASEPLDNLVRLKRALLALKKMQSRLDDLTLARTEPIAIIGMGCRFPGGAENPASFWQRLHEGVDAITEVPADRWNIDDYYDPDPNSPGKMYTRHGGFLDHVDRFDPQFFGISPREAVSLDPQQRLLLEVTWEALEHAGLSPERLAGSSTGVFIGISSNDFSQLALSLEPAEIDHYMGSGISHSVASGRLSYILGLKGPSLSLDTACSSSLVAVHLACQSLRDRECDLALTGGVNLLFAPEVSVSHSRAQMLAADGRCKAFDAAADGFVRAEGCGVVVLKRLSNALAGRDNILALIRGSAVNHDGRTSGLTVPNGPSQQAVIRKALENAGVEPRQVGYVETHGTGTALGDPIEAGALGAALGIDRPEDRPVKIGSVKTNIGHLEAAAGIAGLIKVVLALRHEEIPPHLHLKQPNPLIAWNELPLELPTTRTPWPPGKEPRIAGVSSFGFSGTNAHVILEEAPTTQPLQEKTDRPLHVLTLSAKTEEALSQLAARYAQHLAANPGSSFTDTCFTANTGRSHFSHRLAVVSASADEACEKLRAFAAGQDAPGLYRGRAPVGIRPRVAFLFTGQGSQYRDMGRELYETQPAFRNTLDHCDEILRPLLEKPLLEVLHRDSNGALDQTAYTQPALFSLEYSLARLWMSWGIKPEIAMGHSVGEYVAACVAGVFSLDDGLRLIASRARLMQGLPQGGAMAAVLAEEARVRSVLDPGRQDVSIAAVNGPRHVVISGACPAVEKAAAALEKAGVETKMLNVSHAFHSPLVEPMLAAFERAAAEVTYAPPRLDLVSNVTGELVTSDTIRPGYWCRHAREPVRFADGIQTLHRQGYDIFVEIGPKPTLLGMGRECLTNGAGLWLPSLRQGQSDWGQLLHSLARLYASGAQVDWSAFDHDYERRRVELPTYPFQRQRYWLEPSRTAYRKANLTPRGARSHPLLGQRIQLAGTRETRYESRISVGSPGYLEHHRIFQAAIFPAAAYLEMALAAGADVFKSDRLVLEDVVFRQALILPEQEERVVQLVLTPEANVQCSFQVFSLAVNEETPESSSTLHASGRIRVEDRIEPPRVDLGALRAQIAEEVPVEHFYRELRERGFDFGPSFQAVEKLWRNDGQALGSLRVPRNSGDYKVHPALLDACSQVSGVIAADRSEQAAYIQIGIERLRLYRPPENSLWSHVRMRSCEDSVDRTTIADLRLLDETGAVVAELEGQSARRVNREVLLAGIEPDPRNDFYQIEWLPKPRSRAAAQNPPGYLPKPEAIAASLLPLMAESLSGPELAAYAELLNELDALSVPYVIKAFERMGWRLRLKERFSTAGIAAQLKVIDPRRRLLARLLEMLADQRILQRTGDDWEVVGLPPTQDPKERTRALLAQYPESGAELTLLERCGSGLFEVLRGECDPLQLLFPQGDLTAVSHVYQDSPGARVASGLIQMAVTQALKKLPHDRELRILEIGAGTGGTTASILPHLPGRQTEYVFTDLSPLFTAQAQQKFGQYPFMSYQVLDIEQSPANQGFDSRQFDLLLAFNVLHATRDLRESLHHVKQLLAPGGMLLLLEGTAPSNWGDLVFGLTDGWWRFTDSDLRPSYPLVTASRWEQLLKEMGFESAVAVSPDREAHPALSKQAVILAQAHPAQPRGATDAAGCWLLFADGNGVGRKLAALLNTQGETCILVFPGTSFERISEQVCKIDPARPEEFHRLFAEAVAPDHPPLRGVVHLWSLDAPRTETLTVAGLEAASLMGSVSAVHLVQALTRSALKDRAPLWLVTRGAQPADPQGAPGLAQAPIWGIGKVIALEYPGIWGGLVDLPAPPSEDEASELLAEIWHPDGEDQIAHRNGQRYAARLARSPKPQRRDVPVTADATYLITGGLGALGMRTARWLAKQGARHLALLGRRGAASRAAQESVRRLKAEGIRILVAGVDVADEKEMLKVFEALKTSWPPIRGIVHAAGIPGDQTIDRLDINEIKMMFGPKVLGTWVLEQLTRDMQLDFFVCFSSMVSVWGAKRQAHYVAGNHFLDLFAHYRRAMGLPALTVNWGPLTGGGMLPPESVADLGRIGVSTSKMDQAIETFGYLLRTDTVQTTAVKIDWRPFKEIYAARGRHRLFEQIAAQPDQPAGRHSTPSRRILQELQQAPASERHEILASHIQFLLAQVLGLGSSQLPDLRQGFFDIGMDSLTAMELKSRLELDLGTSLPSTLAFDYTTIQTLADYLLNEALSLGEPRVEDDDALALATARLEQLSETEAEDLLMEKLNQWTRSSGAS